jgi:NAD(P)-dependent dehydrogenase (short-subunit alcohol dehydrogenase family)
MSHEKVALVTGVSSGIGRAIAGLLSHHCFRVFGTARGNGGAKRALENVELVHVDVRNEESVDSCVRAARPRYRMNSSSSRSTGAVTTSPWECPWRASARRRAALKHTI